MKTSRALLCLFAFLSSLVFAEQTLTEHIYNLQQGWNLVGIFLDLTDDSQDALLEHTPYDFKRQGSGGFFQLVTDAEEIVPGKAYWIYSKEASEKFTVKGYYDESMQPAGTGSVTEALVLTPGSKVTRTAPEVEGYIFTKWTATGITLSDPTAKTITFTVPSGSVKLTPNYREPEYYTLKVGSNSSKVMEGKTVTATAPEKTGYSFSYWSTSGINLVDRYAETVSFEMPANNVTLTPNYSVDKYTLTVDGESSRVEYNKYVSETAPEKSGYEFSYWTVEGVSVKDKTAETIYFYMPANDVTLTPNYSVDTYTLTVNGESSQVKYGEYVSETAPEKSGYEFTNWTVEGVSVDDKTAETIYFYMPANNVTLTANYKQAKVEYKTYMVVDLTDGTCRYTDDAPNVKDDTCRTTELWLRKISKGTFKMGSPTTEAMRWPDETQHQVTLTQDYYIGIFEITQKQYKLIFNTCENPSEFVGDCLPVDSVCYSDIRGWDVGEKSWPSSSAVDDWSFMGYLRELTGMDFDLPTEAQWEYACRAGTTTAYSFGSSCNGTQCNCDGQYPYGTSVKGPYLGKTCKVGSYDPNPWNLYDMHGNVQEWCLDRFDDFSSKAVTDPKGPAYDDEDDKFVRRGGSWEREEELVYVTYGSSECRSAFRDDGEAHSDHSGNGFRIAFVPPQQ